MTVLFKGMTLDQYLQSLETKKPDDHLGPYILLENLGRGGFGIVWKAQRREGLAPPCAIKLPTHEIKWEDVEKEARVWLQASGHPNVLPLIEANVYDGQMALVSEYAAGGSLLGWLRRHGGKAPSIEKAIDMMSGILAGLEHLHRCNIIHRDLKPANILLQSDIPRLADFGLSRLLSTTQSRTLGGSLAYMSPEAFTYERNLQIDIWAAGVILYQLLTGRLPFPQQDEELLIRAIMREPPEPLPSDVPDTLRTILMRALEKDLNRRYKSATAMREALLQINALTQSPLRPASPIVQVPHTSTTSLDTDATLTIRPAISESKAHPRIKGTPSLRNGKVDFLKNGIIFALLVLGLFVTSKFLYDTRDTGTVSTVPPVSPSPNSKQSPAPPLAENLQVKVQIGSEPCWLKIGIDTNSLVEGVLNPGDVREFSASEKMILSFGTVTGVTATLNGRPMKLSANGKMVITKSNYRNFFQ